MGKQARQRSESGLGPECSSDVVFENVSAAMKRGSKRSAGSPSKIASARRSKNVVQVAANSRKISNIRVRAATNSLTFKDPLLGANTLEAGCFKALSATRTGTD